MAILKKVQSRESVVTLESPEILSKVQNGVALFGNHTYDWAMTSATDVPCYVFGMCVLLTKLQSTKQCFFDNVSTYMSSLLLNDCGVIPVWQINGAWNICSILWRCVLLRVCYGMSPAPEVCAAGSDTSSSRNNRASFLFSERIIITLAPLSVAFDFQTQYVGFFPCTSTALMRHLFTLYCLWVSLW